MVRAIVAPEMFYRTETALVFGLICDMHRENIPITILTVADEAAKRGMLDEYTVRLTWCQAWPHMASAANYAYYARQVVEAWKARRMAELFASAVGSLQDTNPADVAHQVQAELEALLPTGVGGEVELTDLTNMVYDAWDDTSPRIPLGIPGLGENVPRLTRGELHIIGAAPSVGKTATITQSATAIARKGFKALIVSYEMDLPSIWRRIISQDVELPMHIVQEGPSHTEARRIAMAVEDLHKLKLVLRKPDSASIGHLCALIEEVKPDVAFVDYLQLVAGSGDNRVQQVGDVVRSLKSAAMRVPCVVVAASQLSRQAFDDRSQRPELHHLRESGEIEAAADVILMLWRDKNEEVKDQIASRHIRVAKNRNGPTGEAAVPFNLRCAKWLDYEAF